MGMVGFAAETPMAAMEIRAVVETVMQRVAERREARLPGLLEGLLFTAHAMAAAGAEWMQPPDCIGTQLSHAREELMTNINSLSVDVGRITRGLRAGEPVPDLAPADRIVFDVWPNFHELDRSHFRRVRQGTVRRDAWLEGRDVMAQHGGAICMASCDLTGREKLDLEELLRN